MQHILLFPVSSDDPKKKFQFMKDRVWKKLKRWKERVLSQARCKPSFLWRSLLEGRNLVSLGLRCRIGNIFSTHILDKGHERKVVDLIDFNPSFGKQLHPLINANMIF
ncbi:hypothetical protein M9H77_30691 [Catharanthus roseus]|uniref:Uncharacterized protein n=1 Tax=Catharanthus roseus TaxID=4058 RepID=A0ACC0A003_CATRO|nr:hypothetical protein M9H77_30691 [Catharanthus roseus]